MRDAANIGRATARLLGLFLITTVAAGARCPIEPPPGEQEPSGPFERYLEAHCAALERCDGSHGRSYPSERVCLDHGRALVECPIEVREPERQNLVKLERSWVGGAVVEDCLAWLGSADCDQVHSVEAATCRGLFEYVDGLATGDPCGRYEDVCQTGLVCARHTLDPTICAVCAEASPEAASCDPEQPSCDEGLYCDPVALSCAPLRRNDEGCTHDDDCRSLRCSGGRCAAQRERGGACSENSDCAWELRCVGSVCGDGLDEGAGCQHSGQCLDGLYCYEGTCRAYSLCQTLEGGEPCPFPFDLCEYDDYCSPITGRCEKIPYAYSDCSYVSWECLGELFCDFDENPAECAYRYDDGEPCLRDESCQSGDCDDSRGECVSAATCSMP